MHDELIRLGSGAHALAFQILGNSEDAADAVHDAIAKALGKPGAYDANQGPLRPWFFRVVRNRCIDLLRQRRSVDATAEDIIDSAGGPDQLVEAQQRDAAIVRALQSLPTAQRETIVLRDYLDLSYAEIAGILDVPKGTIMSRLHRSRLALKEALAAYE
ncbi:MAG: RNA polymerase sigma factor [Gammaproteobacteria bacterium]